MVRKIRAIRHMSRWPTKKGIAHAHKGSWETKDKGKIGKTPTSKKWAPEVKKGALHGWSKELPSEKRRGILDRLVKQKGYDYPARRLNFLKNLSADKETDKIASEDMTYLQKKFKT